MPLLQGSALQQFFFAFFEKGLDMQECCGIIYEEMLI